MNILLTGGAGYIGSHAAVNLIESAHKVIVYDNFSNSHPDVIQKIEQITNSKVDFIEGDIRDKALLKQTLELFKIDGVMHFAGLKAVGESVANPLEYFSNNVEGTINLLSVMKEVGVYKLVFSSSATVYGEPQYLPLDEEHPTSSINPYGRTKLQIEEILFDLANSSKDWSIVCLRYFNPVGAHQSGLIGEDPRGIPNNLMPYITRVADQSLPYLSIFGGDYETLDGSAIRDYIHITDLVEGHKAALDYLKDKIGWYVFNLGTGQGQSVLEMVRAFETVTGCDVPYKITDRREGDVMACYAKTDKANIELHWKAKMDVGEMCSSAWNFQKNSQSIGKAA